MDSFHFLGKPVPARAIIGLLGAPSDEISRELQAVRDQAQYWNRDAGPDFTHAGERILIDYTLDVHDPLIRARAARQLRAVRHRGGFALLATWDENLLLQLCDEVWWVDSGRLLAQGDPSQIISEWKTHITSELSLEQAGALVSLDASFDRSIRAGDGRASVIGVELLNAAYEPVLSWMSAEAAHVRVSVRFDAAVQEPVIGMLIRTRVGMNVYGTNTELEGLKLGPRVQGEQIQVSFRFICDLCAGEYALTVASHDPDGTWHEWLEDAVAFSVGDSRYTAGVANLRAEVSWDLLT